MDRATASRRIVRVLEVLANRAAEVLQISNRKLVRSNVFITSDNQWLRIANDFHVNMEEGPHNKGEQTILILNGYFSSGIAYKYFRPVLSMTLESGGGKMDWDHAPDRETLIKHGIREEILEKARNEVNKAHADLTWIVSMPIPYQVSPFKMACGVLNLDGLSNRPFRDQLKNLLADAATAAALIGVINRTTDILAGQCQRRVEIPDDVGGVKKESLREKFTIEPNEFDPSDCPEPSEKFRNALSEIKGIEFFRKITVTNVAEFLRQQLRS